MFTVNALSTFLCYKYAAKQMVKQGRGGRIIGASSLAGKTGAWTKTLCLPHLDYINDFDVRHH